MWLLFTFMCYLTGTKFLVIILIHICMLHTYSDNGWRYAIGRACDQYHGYIAMLINSSPPSAAYMRQWIGSALAQRIACRLIGVKPLSKPMLDYYQLDPNEENSVNFYLKDKVFHSWKYIWKGRLRNGSHFVQETWVNVSFFSTTIVTLLLHVPVLQFLCTAGPTFIKPDQRNPWIKDQLWNDLLSTISHLQLPNFMSCGRDKPSHMTQNLVTVGVKL